ncbi:MAG: hypothetical protein IMY73_02565 [Bacteroidetes bacterium]|nr:hypothetical protein [Bacteroidota bacterium]
MIQYYDLGVRDYFHSIMNIVETETPARVAKVNMVTNYYAQVKIDDKVAVRTKVIKMGTKSITLFQEVYNTLTKKICSDCQTIVAGFNPETGTSEVISEEWKQIIAEHENK